MARRFLFRLQSLLTLRDALEREARQGLARALAEERRAQAHLQDLQAERANTFESRRSPKGKAIDVAQWRLAERYLVVLERRILTAREDLEILGRRSTEAREALVAARRNRLMLLRLKERRQALHDAEILHKDQVELDDLAMLRFRLLATNSVGGDL